MREPYDTVLEWERAFNSGVGDAVARLYAPDALLWGTLASELTTSPHDIRSYFIDAALAGLRVRLGDHVLQTVSGSVAIDTGHYNLFRTRDSQTATFPARYSFVLVKHGASWLIAHHHSSMQPQSMA
ncbi:hypothetical protein ASC80_14260 [Afipia sp. Root123D2]|uniref:nuclear transport factor 2 family protein n=1 Tax=Afipia sp. Root123D2 TaxID=1736436 RepID=UPI000701A66A|nr:nuclear transport factor 2 family protein [Afipia sp. Root123D2]KQW21263.1 hypothetical protein ASC80_14260 [Afipia sp. Root123D2]